MNRPKKPKAGKHLNGGLTFEEYMDKCAEYERDIEIYCDDLENKLIEACKEIDCLQRKLGFGSNIGRKMEAYLKGGTR